MLSFIQNDLKLLEQNYIFAYINSIQTIFLAAVSTVYVVWTNPTLAFIFIAFAFVPMLFTKTGRRALSQTADAWTRDNEVLYERVDGRGSRGADD